MKAFLSTSLAARAACLQRLSSRWAVLVPLGLTLSVALGGCGPSVQAVYEGSIRFEHCYRLDLDTRIVPSHRHACWAEWLQKYTYGQRRDHLEYARQRIEALASGDTATLTLDIGKSEPPAREFYMTVPSPVSAYVAPPPVVPTAPPNVVAPPGHECALECEKQWQACDHVCEESKPPPAATTRIAGRKPAPTLRAAANANAAKPPGSPADAPAASASCDACARDYRGCVQRCMETPAEAPKPPSGANTK